PQREIARAVAGQVVRAAFVQRGEIDAHLDVLAGRVLAGQDRDRQRGGIARRHGRGRRRSGRDDQRSGGRAVLDRRQAVSRRGNGGVEIRRVDVGVGAAAVAADRRGGVVQRRRRRALGEIGAVV